jgi:ribosomal protein S18 acetylase RimI-like enzyme
MTHASGTIGDAAQLAATLGLTLFTTDLYLPGYRETRIGQWKLTRTGFCLDRGYYSGLCGVNGMPVLMRIGTGDGEHRQDWETWMSLSPHEIESQELGCRYARGHTVVMGLGMGWVAINMALNPAVEKVTVIERDPEVIELFQQARALDGLPDEVGDKIVIVLADALEWRPQEPVDFLYADIWRCLEEPQTLDEVRRMQANVRAQCIYFWGQELAIHALAARKPEACADGGEWAEAVRRCVAETIALPLLIPDSPDYPSMIAQVVRLRSERQSRSATAPSEPAIALRPATDGDLKFLFELYASTRAEEKELAGWSDQQWEAFLRMQFKLQHAQYRQNYLNPDFRIVICGQTQVGRLYLDRGAEEIRIVDLSLLPEYRGRGIGGGLLGRVLQEGEDRGVPVTLHVDKNSPALALYGRLGFQVESDRGASWFMVHAPGRKTTLETPVAAGPAVPQ